MKKTFVTRVLLGLCAVILSFSCASESVSMSVQAENRATETESKIVDMYLIAGQSNAAGYSPISDNETETFENVWYAGMTEKVLTGNTAGSAYTKSNTLSSFDSFKKSVTAGLGNETTRIGPEYGIAKTINDMYASSDKQAMIFKTAAGGTSLLDETEELSERFGNWYPRSLWKESYTPNVREYSATNDATGILYQLFIENFEHVYNELVTNGYTPVVKGMAWMQGCTDIDEILAQYAATLKTFICDVRADLAEITGDTSLSAMPFVIGEIAETFNGNPNVNAQKMNIYQRQVAADMDAGVVTIPTADLIITGADGNKMPGCPDKFHFCFKDAVTLGQRFGEKLVELNGQTLVTAAAKNGQLHYVLNDDDSILFQCIPNNHYILEKLIVGGKDVTSFVTENCYTMTEIPNRLHAEAVFKSRNKLSLTYTDLGEGAGYLRKARYWYEGEILSVKIFVNEGYTLEKVTFNGEEMTYNEQTKEYEVLLVQEGEISAVITKNEIDNPSASDNDSSQDGVGCSSVVGTGVSGAIIAICALGLICKKRKNHQV